MVPYLIIEAIDKLASEHDLKDPFPIPLTSGELLRLVSGLEILEGQVSVPDNEKIIYRFAAHNSLNVERRRLLLYAIIAAHLSFSTYLFSAGSKPTETTGWRTLFDPC